MAPHRDLPSGVGAGVAGILLGQGVRGSGREREGKEGREGRWGEGGREIMWGESAIQLYLNDSTTWYWERVSSMSRLITPMIGKKQLKKG